MPDFSTARKNMVDSQIHTAGVVDAVILNAFSSIPREKFAPVNLQKVAYADECLSLGDRRFLLEPATHAKMIQAARPQPHETVLDVGGATGYPAAILSTLAGKVFALEADKALLVTAGALWQDLGVQNITGLHGPLEKGAPQYAPFDLVFINGAMAEIPLELVAQLSPAGRMVAILRGAGEVMGRAVIIRQEKGGSPAAYPLFEAGCPYLPGFEPRESFSF